MYRFKIIFRDNLSLRVIESQTAEAFTKCKILHMMQTPFVL